MFIRASCPECGRTFTYPERSAGKQKPCSACGATVTVPAPDPSTASAQAAAAPPAAATAAAAMDEPFAAFGAAPAATAVAEPASETLPPAGGLQSPLSPPGLVNEAEEIEETAFAEGGFRLPTAADPTDPPHVKALGFELWCLDQNILGGLGLVLVAIVWFVIGWFCDYVFFYPPILAILGIAAIVRGLLYKGPADEF